MAKATNQLTDDAPPLAALLQVLPLRQTREAPLHRQVQQALRELIQRDFSDGQKFYTENILVSRIGVSQGTIRRALSDLTREGLLERHVAKGTFVRKTRAATPAARSVGVFVPTFDSPFWAAMLEQLAVQCREAGMRLAVHYTHRGEKAGDALRLLDNAPSREGVVLMGPAETGDEFHAALAANGYRMVAVDSMTRRYAGAFVGVDNRAGVYLGIDHLVSLGHRRILFLVSEPAGESSITLRITAARERAAEHGVKVHVFVCGTERWQRSFEAAYHRMGEAFEASHGATAVFACADGGAWAVLKWCAERGIRVPQDLSVIGFDDDRPSRFTQPALTTIAQPVEDIAQAAMGLLWAPEPTTEHRLILPRLVVRESTARARNSAARPAKTRPPAR